MSDDRTIESPPEGAPGWRKVWEERLSYEAPGGLLGRLRRIIRRALAPELDRQRDFNIAVLDLLEGVRADLHAIRDDLIRDLEKLDARREERLTVGIRRNDALITVLDQKIEG
ncbi:MAG: hypothetical protein R3338_11420, partial [Thermoanaerobaculia bacterium]|nr:hypothetical protein [Thermoanaerobaculia bacterium]